MIRQITGEEIPECVEVIRKSFQTVADELGFTSENAPRFTAFATNAGRLAYQLHEGRKMFVCLSKEDKIIGYYSLHRQKDRECELNNLCVLPAYRHQKIGEAMLKHAFQTARDEGYLQMNIGIVEENSLLRCWYEAHGFVHIGTQKFDFFPFTCGYMKYTL